MNKLLLVSCLALVAGCSEVNVFGLSGQARGPEVDDVRVETPGQVLEVVDFSNYDSLTSSWVLLAGDHPTGLKVYLAGRGGWDISIYDVESVSYLPGRVEVVDPKMTMKPYSYRISYE